MSPRSMEQNEQIRRQRREEILRAALEVYVEKGYAAAEIGEVAQRAGLARGLVYYYFKDKASLFRELFMVMMDKAKDRTRNELLAAGSVLERFERYARTMCEGVLKDPVVTRFFHRMWHDFATVFPDAKTRSMEWGTQFLQSIAEVVREGIEAGEIRSAPPRLLAMQVWGALSNGLLYLDERQKSLLQEGWGQGEIREALAQEVEATVQTCMRILSKQEKGKNEAIDKSI